MPETILQKLTVATSTTAEAKSEAGPLIDPSLLPTPTDAERKPPNFILS